MATKTYRLKLVGDGREFEAEGDKAFVLGKLCATQQNGSVRY